MKRGALIFLLLCCIHSLMAQSHNRRRVIEILLANPHHSTKIFSAAQNVHSSLFQSGSTPSGLRFGDPIPRFCLPKGAIVCRLEEYVQMHTPMKLNIGLAGQ